MVNPYFVIKYLNDVRKLQHFLHRYEHITRTSDSVCQKTNDKQRRFWAVKHISHEYQLEDSIVLGEAKKKTIRLHKRTLQVLERPAA